jgi:transposase-like protein
MGARTREIFEQSIDAIASDYEGGMALKDIAANYGVSPPTINNWLIRAGYKRRKKGRVPRAMKNRAAELSERGRTIRDIAELLKTSERNVEAWISGQPTPPKAPVGERRAERAQLAGIPDRHKLGEWWTDAQKGAVAGMLESGAFPVAEIYWTTGASRTRQQRIWRELGVGPFPLAKPYEPCPPVEVVTPPPPPPEPIKVTPEDTAQLELAAFRRGVRAALAEANRLAIASGQPSIEGLTDRVEQLDRMSDEEFEEEMERLDALKEFLALPPGETQE